MHPKPGVWVSPASFAINCMPTQIPIKGRAFAHRLAESIVNAVMINASRRAGKAPSPGKTRRSARATTSGSDVTTTSLHSVPRPFFQMPSARNANSFYNQSVRLAWRIKAPLVKGKTCDMRGSINRLTQSAHPFNAASAMWCEFRPCN